MSRAAKDIAIGGYFALERDIGTGLTWLDDATGYQSARSALAAVLDVARPAIVWAPNFICGAINDTLRSTGVQVRRYARTESLGVPDKVDPSPADLLICVDYFGINAIAVDQAIDRFGIGNILVDASQSLFLRHRPGGTTIYSPRKFFGIPDGGLLRTSRKLPPLSAAAETDSLARSRHLVCRWAGLVDVGYAMFQAAEESLSGCEPVAMSRLTDALLRSIDVGAAVERRVRNYQGLAALLRPSGFEIPCLPSGAVPLCCPVRCHDAIRVRRELTAQHIFTPTYWPDAVIPDTDHVALGLRDRTVYLPCDQRYAEPELLRIASSLLESMEVL
jgi:hypothetical protein